MLTMKQLHALILGPPRDPLDPQMPQPGICLSLHLRIERIPRRS